MIRILVFIICFCVSIVGFANNIIVNGTRFIYSGGEKEITIQLTNNANRPAIAQSWLDNGDSKETPDTIKTPFLLTPPVARLAAKGGQAIRIKLVDPSSLANDKESLFWLNILDIPPSVNATESKNVLQFAIRSRFKFFYRPKGLGDRNAAPSQLELTAKNKQLTIYNPSPFFITISQIINDEKSQVVASSMMIPPKEQIILENKFIKSGDSIVIYSINDYGSDVAINKVVK